MSYKGYEIHEVVLHSYAIADDTAVVLDAPCGCMACEEQVQPGHFQCSTSPDDLKDDPNVTARLDSRLGWFWEWRGPNSAVDSWLKQ